MAIDWTPFVDLVRRGGEGDVATGRDGLVVQAVVDAMYASAENGHEVEVRIPEVTGGAG